MKRRILISWLICLLPLCCIQAQESHWQCDIRSFQYDMTMYVTLSLDGTPIVQDGYEVAAFCGDECRGVATVETIAGTDKAYYYLRVRSNVAEGETISFKYYDIVLKKEIEVVDTINFTSQSILGCPSTPFTLTKVNYCEINVWAEDNGIVTGGGIVSEGSEVTLLAIPNEGYHFVEWSDGTKDNPYVFVARVNKEISASFAVNKYEVTYIVDGEVMKKDSIEYGATIIIPDSPIKEGYTFSGWIKVPETMPAEDITIDGVFIINKYLVTFKIGDEVIASDSLEYGATIIAPESPEKEGYTFNGWGEVAAKVPASDLTYEGSYSVNSYLLTYTVDGEIVRADSVAYGTTIILPETPEKEGHTFSGWDGVPETMPAKDLTISGTFIINKYLVTFMIGDEVIASYSLEYGADIVVPAAPEKEGHTFNGWGEVAETVPAGDVTYEGTYTVNIYKVYYYVGEELVHTAEVAYGEAIPENVYESTEEGYTFLGWVGEAYATMPAHDVTYTANIDDAIEHLTIDHGELTIYDLAGRKVTDTENLRSGIYIINGRKVIVK